MITFKNILEKVIFFLIGIIIGFILAIIFWKPVLHIEVPVVREITKTKTIEKPSKTEIILKSLPPETLILKEPWYRYTFEDSILSASFEAKTESVQNFIYTILRYPELIKYVEKEKVKYKSKDFSILCGWFYKDNIFLGGSFKHFGLIAGYSILDKRPNIGVFLKFDFK